MNALVLVFNSTSSQAEIWYDDDWADSSGRFMQAEISNITNLAGLTGLSNTDFVEFLF